MRVVSHALTLRLEQAEGRCWYDAYAEMSRLPGNPHGLEVRRMGEAWVYSCTEFPTPGFANKVIGAGAGDVETVAEALAFFAARGVRASVEVAPGDDDSDLLQFLREQGLHAKIFCSVLYAEPTENRLPLPSGVQIRQAETAADMDLVARLHRDGMGISPRGECFFRETALAAHRLPQFRHYIAEVDGHPAAQAWLHLANGVGTLVAGATLPAYRGRGLQTALIHHRVAEAAAAGCDLVCSQTDPITASQNNLERAGFRLAYTKMEFHPID